MEIGDKEWFEKLNERVKFPNVFAFYVSSERTINSQVVDTKASSLDNIKYGMIKPPILFGGQKTALASVKRCESDQEYYNECMRLKDVWK